MTAGASLLDSSGRRIVVQDATGRDRGAPARRRHGRRPSARGSASPVPRATPGARRGSPRRASRPIGSGAGIGADEPWPRARPSATSGFSCACRARSSRSSGSATDGGRRSSCANGAKVPVHGPGRRRHPVDCDRGRATDHRDRDRQAPVPDRERPALRAPATERRRRIHRPGRATAARRLGRLIDVGEGRHADRRAPRRRHRRSRRTRISPRCSSTSAARVRVGGLIAKVTADGFDLDDGTALAHVELRGRHGRAAAPSSRRRGRRGDRRRATRSTGRRSSSSAPTARWCGSAASARRSRSAASGRPRARRRAERVERRPSPPTRPAWARDVPRRASSRCSAISVLSVLATLVRRRLLRRRLRAVLVDRLATLRPKGD